MPQSRTSDSKNATELVFRPKARIIRLLGENLLKDDITALLELVKNSHDADASFCKITFKSMEGDKQEIRIQDDGTGMSREDIINFWLVPGTTNKIKKIYTAKGRRVQGEKGLGRFATDKIANTIEILTKTIKMNKTLRLDITWNDFETSDTFLDDVPISLKEETHDFPKEGTLVVLTNLRKKWNEKDLKNLRYGLTRLIPPYSGPQKFTINLEAPDYPKIEGIIHTNILKKAPFQIYAKLENGEINAEVVIKLRDRVETMKQVIRVSGFDSDEKISKSDLVELGPVQVDIGAFILSKRGVGIPGFISDLDRKLLRQWHGVGIYSDGFWIYPYGEDWYDWLRLFERRVDKPAQRFDNSQITGFVRISRDMNKGLVQQINREGLVHNKSYEVLKAVVLSVIAELERSTTSSGARKNLYSSTDEVRASDVTSDHQSSIQDIRKDIQLTKRLIQEGKSGSTIEKIDGIDKTLEGLGRELEEERVIWSKHAALGNMVGHIIHVLNHQIEHIIVPADTLKNKIRNISLPRPVRSELMSITEDIENSFRELSRKINQWTPFIKTRTKYENLHVYDFLMQLKKDFATTYPKLNIEISCQRSIDFKTNRSELWMIIKNIVDNANYWTQDEESPKVEIIVHKQSNQLIFRLTNNGERISPQDRKKIFLPGWTKKNYGSGLGLAIAASATWNLGGELFLLNDPESKKGEKFEIRFGVPE